MLRDGREWTRTEPCTDWSEPNMGKAKHLKPDQIAAITALCKAGHANKETSEKLV